MAGDFGVADRGHFYDPVGALRDVVVNHLMLVVGATAMEAPTGRDLSTLKDGMASTFRAMPPADPAHYVRGQYDGYRAIDGVAEDSATETCGLTAVLIAFRPLQLVGFRPLVRIVLRGRPSVII